MSSHSVIYSTEHARDDWSAAANLPRVHTSHTTGLPIANSNPNDYIELIALQNKKSRANINSRGGEAGIESPYRCGHTA